MTKTFASFVLSGALCSVAVAADLHLAESAGSFRLHRSGDVMTAPASSPTVLMASDSVVANGSPVRLHTATGSTVVLGPTSEAVLTESGSILLNSGEALMDSKGGSYVTARDLTIAPISEETEASYAVMLLENGAVRVTNVGESTVVVRNADAEQVAVVSSNDMMTFAPQRNGAWSTHMRTDERMRVLQQQEEGVTGDVEDDEDRDEVAWWWFPAGAAAAVGLYFGGRRLWDDQLDDFINGSGSSTRPDPPRRRPFSPIVEPPVIIEPPGEDEILPDPDFT